MHDEDPSKSRTTAIILLLLFLFPYAFLFIDERLRTKALNVKIACLEEERDQLLNRLKHYEVEYGADRNQPLPNHQLTAAPRIQRKLSTPTTHAPSRDAVSDVETQTHDDWDEMVFSLRLENERLKGK